MLGRLIRAFWELLSNFARTENPSPPQALKRGLYPPPQLTETIVRSWCTTPEDISYIGPTTVPGEIQVAGSFLVFTVMVGQELAGRDLRWVVTYRGNLEGDRLFEGEIAYGQIALPLERVKYVIFKMEEH